MYDRYLVERDVIFAVKIGEAKCTKEMQIERNRYLYVSPRSIKKKRTYRCCFAKNGHSLISVNATVCKTTDDFSDFHFSVVFLAVVSRRNEKMIYFLLIESWATKKHKRISNIELSTKRVVLWESILKMQNCNGRRKLVVVMAVEVWLRDVDGKIDILIVVA